jgi:hypothetical protein
VVVVVEHSRMVVVVVEHSRMVVAVVERILVLGQQRRMCF